MKNPQFPEMLTLLTELKTLKIDNVKISLGRLQVKVYWRQKNKHRVKEKDNILDSKYIFNLFALTGFHVINKF